MSKKQTYKNFLFGLFIFIIFSPVILYAFFQIPYVQKIATQKVSKSLSNQLNTEVSIRKISYTVLNDIIIKDLYIEDYRHDTLLYIQKFSVRPLNIKIAKSKVRLHKVNVIGLKTNIYADTSGYSNLQFLLDNISSAETDEEKPEKKSNFQLKIDRIKVKKSSISYFAENSDTTEFEGMDFNDIFITNLNSDIKNFHFVGDSLSLNLKNLSFKDKSGFELKEISSEQIIYSSKTTSLEKFRCIMPETYLEFEKIALNYKNMSDFEDFINNVNLDVSLEKGSEISLADLAYLSPQLWGFDQKIKISTKIDGTVSSLNINDLSVKYSDQTHLHTNISLVGLPNIEQTYFDIKIDTLTTSRKNINSIKDPKNPKKQLVTLPKELRSLGKINYKAEITGLKNNFSLIGNLKSNLGKIGTDIQISQDSTKTNILGLINTNELDLGKFLNNPKLGKLSLNDTIDLNLYNDKTISGSTGGKIANFTFNDYTYHNILITGDFTDKSFDGNINIQDTNLVANFEGKVNFAEELPEFNFALVVDSAQLHKLNFEKNDSLSYIKLAVAANVKGATLDEITGQINFTDQFFYTKNNDTLTWDSLKISSYVVGYAGGRDNKDKEITLRSDFVDGRMRGYFEFSELMDYSTNLITTYLPALKSDEEKEDPDEITEIVNKMQQASSFFFNFDIKNIDQFTNLFAPQVTVSENSMLRGYYNGSQKRLMSKFSSDSIVVSKKQISNIKLNTDTKDDSLKIDFNCDKIKISDDYFMDSITLKCAIRNDTASIKLKWNNKSDSINKGNISFTTAFEKVKYENADTSWLKISAKFVNDTIFMNSTAWLIKDTEIQLDTAGVKLENVVIANMQKKQMIGITGQIAKDSNDFVSVLIQNFDLSELKPVVGDLGIEGKVSGTTKIINPLGTPLINSYNVVANTKFNKVDLETIVVQSKYIIDPENADSTKINIEISTQKNTNDGTTITQNDLNDNEKDRYLELKGDYYVNSQDIDFRLDLHKLKLKAFHPYFDNILDKISSTAMLKGYVNIGGNAKNPQVEGDVAILSTTFRVKFTQVIYNINGALRTTFNNNEINIHKSKLVGYGGRGDATLVGQIKHKDFKDFDLNVLLSPDSLLFMNLPETDSSLYFGQFYATGEVNIKGKTDNLIIDAQLKTEDKTDLSILLNNKSDIKEENTFITFVQRDTLANKDTTEYKINDEIKVKGITLNINVEVNPLSKFKLIMDKTTGEIIYLQSEGNLRFKLNPLGDMLLLGKLSIIKGIYNFQMQNIISKKFEIEKGSTIEWTGAPTDAELDLDAMLKIKNVSLFDLVLDEEYREEKTTAECHIRITESLMSPNLTFDVELPKADERVVSQLDKIEQQDINKQVLSLLILSRFQPLPGLTSNEGGTGENMINTSEVLSNQLTNWLSEINSDMDITVGELSTDQVEVAVSQNLFDDRITINAEMSTGDDQTKTGETGGTSSVLGDFEVEAKLNKKGTIKAKAFNESNRTEIYDKGPYTQGISIFFKKDFDWLIPKKQK